MSRITWDAIGEHFYETGVDQVVLYTWDATTSTFKNGVAWNGVTAINESPSGAESNPLYADNIKYLDLLSAEDYGFTIEAYASPEEFDECDGAVTVATGTTIRQQNRKPFAICYRTLIGNDTEGTNKGYKLHLIYNATASPSEQSHSTVNENPEAASLSWECKSTPVAVTGHKPTSVVEIDCSTLSTAKKTAIETILYGGENAEARMPLPDEVISTIGNE